MANNRKYAALPDLDSAPDIYETPDLTDDNSTAPRGRGNSQSSTSSYKDFEDEDEETPGISRSRLHPNDARSIFSPSQVDARDVDFSDRITAKRKSYKVSTRRQRLNANGVEQFGDFSDEDDVEPLKLRLARLRREIEETKSEYSQKLQQGPTDQDDEEVKVGQEIADLSIILSEMVAAPQTNGTSKLLKNIGTSVRASAEASELSDGSATCTVTYAPTFQQSHALAKAADFDGRLTSLENLLGLNSNSLPTEAGEVRKPILPTLDSLQKQIAVLSNATPASLDNLSRRIRTLSQDADKLMESRKASKAALDALKAAGGDLAEESEGSEQAAKINALYGALPTIENLSPLLPPLLDRLRSLRAIHADAATASESLERAERRQAEMAVDIKGWEEALSKAEESMRAGASMMTSNMDTIQGWVKELEERVNKL